MKTVHGGLMSQTAATAVRYVGRRVEYTMNEVHGLTPWLWRLQLGGLVAACFGAATGSMLSLAFDSISAAILVLGLTAFFAATIIRSINWLLATAEHRKRQYSLAGMLGYITVLAVLLSVPRLIGQFGNDTPVAKFAGVGSIIALAGWIGYGLWVAFGRRKRIVPIVASLVFVVVIAFVPAVAAIAEDVLFGTHHIEHYARAIGWHGVLDDFYDTIGEALGLY